MEFWEGSRVLVPLEYSSGDERISGGRGYEMRDPFIS
jgi:hypothetical protein